MELMELLEKAFLTYEECNFIDEHEDVKSVENCGNSGLYPNKTWYNVVLTNGDEYSIYL